MGALGSDGSAKIRIDNLSHEYFDQTRKATVTALRNIDVTINDEEFVCILGPSGCGKSTLLNIVAGFIRPTKGKVYLDGKEIVKPGPDRAMVFQEHALFPWLTVQGNVEFGLEMQGKPKEERKKIAKQFISLVGLSGFEDRYPFELSGGMKQRLGLARSLAINPEVLLLDEPFASLDAQARRIMQDELLRILSQSKKTSILVTHSIDEAVYLADRLVLLSARPGMVLVNEEIDLPRPRSRTDERFVSLVEKFDSIIRKEVNRAEGKEEQFVTSNEVEKASTG
ncbi:MAG: ABC transporter ATP-binding protein [Conexivisphaerales archaeon]